MQENVALWSRITCPTLFLSRSKSSLPDPKAAGVFGHFADADDPSDRGSRRLDTSQQACRGHSDHPPFPGRRRRFLKSPAYLPTRAAYIEGEQRTGILRLPPRRDSAGGVQAGM